MLVFLLFLILLLQIRLQVLYVALQGHQPLLKLSYLASQILPFVLDYQDLLLHGLEATRIDCGWSPQSTLDCYGPSL